ncbi:MAG TPA: FtsX-like permease family protein [Candidatus Dormibacteraeota bacterium]
MSPTFYVRYAARSLRRGGQRSLLAVFCVAVGVMAVVSLQLAANMVSLTLTGDARAANGGDVSVSGFQPLRNSDLAYFGRLQDSHLVTQWTATSQLFSSGRHGTDIPRPLVVQVVDPAAFPLAGEIRILRPSGGVFADLVKVTGSGVISSSEAELLGVGVGDSFDAQTGVGPMTIRVAGITEDSGFFGALSVFVSPATARAQARAPIRDENAYFLVAPGKADEVKKRLAARLPTATVQTVADVLASRKAEVGFIGQFLSSVGLVALLVGGIGIVHTMQVLLSRRRLEIAVLKTEGYRARDLYLLFGTEAVMLGVAGGVLGSLIGLGVSAGVRLVLQNVLLTTIYFSVDASILAGGVLIGAATALIFGLMPIAQAAATRPIAVLRDLPDLHRARAWLATGFLFAIVVALFAVFASVILSSPSGGIEVTLMAVCGLGALNLIFRIVLKVFLAYPVPERFTPRFTVVMAILLLTAIGLTLLIPPVGVLMLAFVVGGIVLVVLPTDWKATAKLALRGIGRERARSAATLVALFVGIFAIALIVVIADDTKTKADALLAVSATYNVEAQEAASRATVLESSLPTLPGLESWFSEDSAPTNPVSVKGTPYAQFQAQMRQTPGFDPVLLEFFTELDGYDVAGDKPAKTTLARDSAGAPLGRALTASDRGTNNVVAPAQLSQPPFSLAPGDQVVVADSASGRRVTVTLVGFYSELQYQGAYSRALVGDIGQVDGLGPDAARLYGFKVAPSQKDAFIKALINADPQAEVLDVGGFEAVIFKFLGNFVVMLLALASLALLAGIVIIANAVTLAMLERRREIGIMKSVGFASRAILAQVVLENAVLGVIGGASAIAVVGGVIYLFGHEVIHYDLGVNYPLEFGVVVVTAAVCAVVAGAVAATSARVRPLEILRYE